jgi:nucleoside-diphosphate-sugar epimerase
VTGDRAVLVTGATGVIGQPLLERLGESAALICLQHRGAVDHPMAEVVHADVTRPRFGLDPAAYADLCERVGVVVNAAAITDFTEPRDEVFAVNVGGLGHALTFAADAGARVLQLSTAFVTVHNEVEAGWVSPRHYLDSKRAGDDLALSSDVDCHVLHPSVLIGDSRTGETTKLQGFHAMGRSLLRGRLPILVVDEGDRLDFVANDQVADILAAMVHSPPPGRESWITAGKDAWTVAELVGVFVEEAAAMGDPVDAPRLVTTDMLDRLIRPVFFEELPKRVIRRFEQVMSLAPTFIAPGVIDSTIGDLEAHYGRSFAIDREAAVRASARFLHAGLETAGLLS